MNLKFLALLFILGVLAGFFMFNQPTTTGAATFDCYVENELCDCGPTECVCGDVTVPEEYCSQIKTHNGRI